MRAVHYDRQGPAEEVLTLSRLERPSPGAGEVLVEVDCSAVHPSDVKTRAGLRAPMAFDRIIPHSDGAGRIVEVGQGVDPARTGQRVWLYSAAWQRAHGTAAEYVALPSEQAVPLPDAASFADGACLGIPAQTAHACLFEDGPIDGKTILVTGGAGTVGAYAIQMGRLAGARIITTVSSAEKAAHAERMGADVVVNYRETDAAAEILEATQGRGVDRIVEVEFGGNLDQTRAVLRDGGVIAAYGSMAVPEPILPFTPMMFANQTLRMLLLYKLDMETLRAAWADINAWLARGALQHPVARRFALPETAAAHAYVESGQRIGTVLVDLGDAAGV